MLTKHCLTEVLIGFKFSSDNKFFVIYSENKLYLYNFVNITFECWTDFTGNIKVNKELNNKGSFNSR